MNTSDRTAPPHANPPAPSDDGKASPALKQVMGPGLLLLFVVGDILGTGVYALTGQVAGEVGGAAWLPFLIAFVIAMMTALSYLELVTKYPQAAGAALYVHKAFGVHFITFMVMFTVMCSGITSASTASRAFAVNMVRGLTGSEPADNNPWLLVVALGFIFLVMLINLRGVAEGVKANVVLTLIEVSGLLLVIFIGLWAITQGRADWSQVVAFQTSSERNTFVAVTASTSLAFFAMVGFEDAVNMAEETKEPTRIFPRILLSGLTVTGVIYVVIAIISVALVPVGNLAASEAPLVLVVENAAPGFPINQLLPWISMFAVANSALINMLMASRLIYGMAQQDVLPGVLARVLPVRRTPWTAVLFTTAIAAGLILYVSLARGSAVVGLLGGTTSLLLLAVFAVVNLAVVVLKRDRVGHKHFRTSRIVAIVACLLCLFLVLPVSGRPIGQYQIAGVLIVIGVALWAVTVVINKRVGRTELKHPEDIPPEVI
ncbi:APC family permease [Propionibacterium freudenreichii]|uniref:APC family permease n=1 Tax=Propionibacterium freudenreichii TaxID=1744 RepID=UPI0005A5C65A|nr:APC family permease [Propionibacterium freudenreichii]CEI30352.1 Amino acid permease-associated region [Propionibacterium freudenreichii]SBN40266.1 Cationic amino acid transporter [Propionibacterium freudenreichii]SCQ54678.1 Cationic amino acid transporter [Propionibacterium freudenreichii]SCQ57505.1 Cationic amino acid transporter [Propionibacterium freudenreichii]SCQ60071.1 Cationic amino acid transporter [Propionibacterium freudenreichii]